MKHCSKCCELEPLVLDYINKNPRCSIEDIARSIGCHYMTIYRILEGRKDSRSIIGLVNSGAVKVVAGISSKGRLCWTYEAI
jgi:hypothetical protein